MGCKEARHIGSVAHRWSDHSGKKTMMNHGEFSSKSSSFIRLQYGDDQPSTVEFEVDAWPVDNASTDNYSHGAALV